MTPHHGERGNVLFYILIAIIVLTALTFAMSRGGRESTATVNREQSELFATQILDYVGMIRRGVQMISVNGIRAQDICFYSDSWGNADYDPVPGNPVACPDPQAAVFGTSGGGASFQQPDSQYMDVTKVGQPAYGKWYFTGANSVTGVGSDGNGADSNELLLVLPYIARDVCVALNKRLQIANPLTPPQDDANFNITTPFAGGFVAGNALNTTNLEGVRSGCFASNTVPVDGSFVFYAVLIAR